MVGRRRDRRRRGRHVTLMPLTPGARFQVRVVTRASRRGVAMSQDGTLVVRVTEPPEHGRANTAVIEALAKHFQVGRRSVRIVQGTAARQKLIQIG